MKRTLGRSQESSCTNPLLDVWYQYRGFLYDPLEVAFQVWYAGAQLFPGAGWQSVDTSDCPAGNRLGLGHYVLPYTVAPDADVGRYQLKLRSKLDADADYEQWEIEIEVVETAPTVDPGYGMIVDVRDEGIAVADASDDRVARTLAKASRSIERITSRRFGQFYQQLELDGHGGKEILIGEPIIGIDQVQITWPGVNVSSPNVYGVDEVFVYNRHLTQNLFDPDDRNSPKIAFQRYNWDLGREIEYRPTFPTYYFARGRQNVHLNGLFGYTEPDGSPTGGIPPLIQQVAMLIALRGVLPRTSSSAVAASRIILEERTRDQSVKYAKPGDVGESSQGPYYGDQEIDNILLMYSAPPGLGAV